MKNKKNKILYIIAILLFITLNCIIVAYGHRLTYDRATNNCTHMSSQLEGMFEKLGIPVTLKVGTCEGGGKHMWIKIGGLIEVDSVNLFFVINTKYNQRIVEYVSFDEYEHKKY